MLLIEPSLQHLEVLFWNSLLGVVLKAIYSLILKVLWVLKKNLYLLNEGERADSYLATYTVRGRSEPLQLAVVSHNISDPQSGFGILVGKETK